MLAGKKRFKTPKYKSYELEMILRLPSLKINTNVPLRIDMTFGFSNSLCDVDNPVKPVLDILQKVYDKWQEHSVFKS